MENIEITTLSSRGQIVIPNSIRKELNVNEGSKFVIMTDGNNILLKQLEKPKMTEFRNLINESKNIIKSRHIKKVDINTIINNVRKNKSRN